MSIIIMCYIIQISISLALPMEKQNYEKTNLKVNVSKTCLRVYFQPLFNFYAFNYSRILVVL